MDEIELRLAALEMAFIAVAAWLDDSVLADGASSIRAHLTDDLTADERAARLGALQLIDDARRRYAPPATGLSISPSS